jgi:hypothetical protein
MRKYTWLIIAVAAIIAYMKIPAVKDSVNKLIRKKTVGPTQAPTVQETLQQTTQTD